MTNGCPALVRNGKRCPEHQRQAEQQRDQQRGSSTARGYDRQWRKLAAEAIRIQPWCSRCLWPGSEDNPLTVDHRVALARGGERLPSLSELTVLCRSCNSSKGAR